MASTKQKAVELFKELLLQSRHYESAVAAMNGKNTYCNALKNAETFCLPQDTIKPVFFHAAELARELGL